MRTKGGMSRQQQKDKPSTEPTRPTFLTLPPFPRLSLSLTPPTQHTIQKREEKKNKKEEKGKEASEKGKCLLFFFVFCCCYGETQEETGPPVRRLQ